MRHTVPMASQWSIASGDSFLSIASRGSILSIGSVGSVGSIGSIGSTMPSANVGAVMGQALPGRTRWWAGAQGLLVAALVAVVLLADRRSMSRPR